jgi:hypothetical protein
MTGETLAKTFDKGLVRFGEIGAGIGTRLLRLVHQFRFGYAFQ